MIVFVALLCVLGFGFDAFYLGVGGGYVPVGSLMALVVGAVSASVGYFHGDRAVLAAPIDGRLFFAGEATSPHFFSTAHGARDSGERAAREVLADMKPGQG